ncbi:YbaB/EbfC family nucleoid-associated protein [Amycolatopsis sp. H20-H5]|uniref:YbaB/EbfC family nucleoid-associated protein n=1 Tax=Amycolatopsis sp. H20-H5 TaxID=3046309 RepID=UPI002DBABACC|nr:YbaB/EbfC family nucleoid-associated protein [Amycolatopsis sp. H20-H5]MEC3975681.1 YbaB/EbfC family nucleoid-associated protein [Amycolatopsis sp. H20-H5]
MDREARLDEKIRSFQEQAAKAAELKDRIAGLRGSARNGDGSVTVTVAPSGAVLGLQLGPQAMRRSHTALQQEILATIRQATQQAASALEEAVQPILGERAEQFKQAFNAHVEPLGPSAPPPAESLPAAPPPVPPTAAEPAQVRQSPPPGRNRPRPDDVEDENFGGSILR